MFFQVIDRGGRKRPAQAGQHGGKWRGVTVLVTERCCPSACALAGRRLLTAEAPLFPLPDCTQSSCDCRYRHFEDRRVRGRRADRPLGLARRVTDERRQTADRRGDEASA